MKTEKEVSDEYWEKFNDHLTESRKYTEDEWEAKLNNILKAGQDELKKARTERIKYLTVTSRDPDEADGVLSAEIPGWSEKTFTDKMNFLKNNFKFNMISGFTQETDKEKIAKENYYATLQYLISEAKDFGIVSVIRAEA